MSADICTRFESIPAAIIGRARAEGCRVSHRTSYPAGPVPADSLAFEGACLEWKDVDHDGDVGSLIYRFDNGILEINIVGERVIARSYAASDGDAEALLALTKEHIRPMELAEDVVPVTFWRNMPKAGARPTTRKITSPKWEDIGENYVQRTRRALDQLVSHSMDTSLAGKLVLWHGEPGTGKTYALRAWARSCIDTVDVNYIVDPEVFFSNSGYMMELLTRMSPKELSLFVAEDTGELLARDAKRSIGQGLSRLLNICDGLIGQGMRILFLITTNEDLGSLHPAVVRPGRCHANISFEPFGEDEAARWLSARGVDAEGLRARSTIAELYSMVEGRQIAAERPKPVGFIA